MHVTRPLLAATALVAGLKLASDLAVRRYEYLRLDDTEPEGSLANIEGLGIHYLDAGQGNPLVLLHGLGASTFSFRQNLPQLSRSFRVIVPDMPGHGRSSRAVTDLSVTAQARHLATLLDHLGIEGVSIAGHSMGGSVAQRFAASWPERVERLVLIASTTDRYMMRASPLSPLLAPFIPAFATSVLHNRRGRDRWLRRVVHAPSYLTPEIKGGYEAPGHIRGTVAAYQRLMLDRRHDEPIELGSIQAPALIIWGDSDCVVTVDHGRRLADAIPDSRLVVVPEAGHLVQEEQALTVNQLIEEFVGQGSQAPAPAGATGAR